MNTAIANLVAEKMRNGLVHPGNRDEGKPATPLALPFGQVAGRPKEHQDLINGSVQMMAEAIVHTIETDGNVEFVDRGELAALRHAAGDTDLANTSMPVYCRCGTLLMVLSVIDPGNVRVDGPSLLRSFEQLGNACPHGKSS
jgi:hypothetical protein